MTSRENQDSSEGKRAANLDQLDQVIVSAIVGHHYILCTVRFSIVGVEGVGGFLVGKNGGGGGVLVNIPPSTAFPPQAT